MTNPVTTPILWEKLVYLPHTSKATLNGKMVFMYHNPVLKPNLWHIFIEGSTSEPYTARSQSAAEVSALRMVGLLSAPEETTMHARPDAATPRPPNQLPPGDPSDAAGKHDETEFDEGEEEDEGDFEDADDEDDQYRKGEDDDDV